jgi:hypothetical protein
MIGRNRSAEQPISQIRRRETGSADGSCRGVDARDIPADDEGPDCFGALEGVDGLDVNHVPDDVEVEQDAVAAEQVAGTGQYHPGLLVLCRLEEVAVTWRGSYGYLTGSVLLDGSFAGHPGQARDTACTPPAPATYSATSATTPNATQPPKDHAALH